MSRSRYVVVLAVIAGIWIAPHAQAKDAGVKALDAAWVKAVTAGSVDDVMACYADDAVGWFPGSPEAKGAKAIRAAYESWLGANTIKDATYSETHYHNAGKLSMGWGKIALTLVEKASGKTTTMTARFSAVAERRDGRWLYVVDHASDEPAPAPAAAPAAPAPPAAPEAPKS